MKKYTMGEDSKTALKLVKHKDNIADVAVQKFKQKYQK